MPVGGSEYGLFPDMNEEEHRIIEAKIPLFQAVYPKPVRFEEKIFGVFGVKVSNPNPENRNSKSKTQWFSSGDSSVLFKPRNKNGLGIAWIPDDPWMHNRMLLMTSPIIRDMIKQCRLPNGAIKSAAIVFFEIKTMQGVLMDTIKIWESTKNGKRDSWFTTKKEAQEYTASRGHTEVRFDHRTGKMKPMAVNRAKYDIVEGERSTWKPEVAALIMKEKNRHRFGWTESDEFKTKWRPAIMDKIKEEKSEFEAANEDVTVQQAVDAMDRLPEGAIERLVEKINARKKPAKKKAEEVAS